MSVIQVLVNMVAIVRMAFTSIIARVLSGTLAQTVNWTWLMIVSLQIPVSIMQLVLTTSTRSTALAFLDMKAQGQFSLSH